MIAKLVQKYSWLEISYNEAITLTSSVRATDLFCLLIRTVYKQKTIQQRFIDKFNSQLAHIFSKYIKHMANYGFCYPEFLDGEISFERSYKTVSQILSIVVEQQAEAIQATSKAIQSMISHATTSALQKPKSCLEYSRTRHSHESIHRFINFI